LSAQDTLVVHEIYRSIQGESSFAGRRCAFVRLTGCNLRCRWCDTPHAFKGGTRMTLDAIVDATLALDTELVLLTGGEPLLQPAAPALLTRLCDAGKTVLLETSGERDVSAVDPRVHRIVDLKAPGSGEDATNRWQNLPLLGKRDEIKLVLADRRDYEWAREVIEREQLHARVGEVLLSCVHGELDPKQLVEWVMADALPVRVQLQLHKYIWSPSTTGV
jgi:7-carboxy-7-deazaguanine synthase